MLIRNAKLIDGSNVDIHLEGNRFGAFSPAGQGLAAKGEETFDAAGLRILPPFYNCHCHIAMVLLRGYADDLELFPWLNEHIWPAESKLTPEDMYVGSRLAILEMIKSGTVFFNDMYFKQLVTIRAAEELGVRAAISPTWLDPTGNGNPKLAEDNEEIIAAVKNGRFSSRISVEYGPHAIYTVTEKDLRGFASRSAEDGLPVHIHLAETKKELEDCKAAHNGLTPVEYLDSLGLLNERARLAHCVWLGDHDIELLAARRAVVELNTTSNMKLCSGLPRFRDLMQAGVRITLGTDGCASNNSHSMFSEMKFAALAAKIQSNDSTAGSAEQVFNAATLAGAEAFSGERGGIAPGALADAMFIDEDQPYFVGDYNIVSNLVYAGESSCVDSLLCDGKMIMTHRQVPGEEQILDDCRRACDKFRR